MGAEAETYPFDALFFAIYRPVTKANDVLLMTNPSVMLEELRYINYQDHLPRYTYSKLNSTEIQNSMRWLFERPSCYQGGTSNAKASADV